MTVIINLCSKGYPTRMAVVNELNAAYPEYRGRLLSYDFVVDDTRNVNDDYTRFEDQSADWYRITAEIKDEVKQAV